MSVSLQTIEGFDAINAFGLAGNGFCNIADGGPGCGASLSRVHGPIPPHNVVGSDATWSSLGYTLVTGWSGTGLALSAPNTTQFNFTSGVGFNTILVSLRWKVSSLASTQRICDFGGAWRFQVSTAGKLQLMNLGSGGTTVTSVAASVVTGTWYHTQWAIYVAASGGAYRLQQNGVADATLTNTSLDTKQGLSSTSMVSVTFNNSTAVVDDFICLAGDGGFSADDFLGDTTRLPVLSTMLPTAQGANNQWNRYTLSVGGTYNFIGAGNSTNYQYVDDAQGDAPTTHLRAGASGENGFKDSYRMAALDATAGDILIVQTNVLTAAGGDGRTDSYFFTINGLDYFHDDDGEFQYITPGGAQWQYSARWWPNNPATRGWEAADFLSGCEFGARVVGVGAPQYVSQVQLMIVWLVALPVETALTGVGPCEPCTDTLDAFFVDSGVIYDGRNSVTGGITTSTSTMTLSINPAGNWTTVGGEHLLTCSTALFTGGDAFYVGKAIRLTGADGASVICDIIDHNAGDLTLDVTIRSAVPVSLQAVATGVWALMIKTLTLTHLEAKTVSILADGIVQDQEVVTAGTVTIDDHAAVIVAGLPITAILHTLPIDSPSAPSAISDLPKDVPELSIIVEASITFKMGSRFASLDPVVCDPDTGESDLVSRIVSNIQRRDHQWGDGGQTWIVQDDPLPLTILGIVTHIELGKH